MKKKVYVILFLFTMLAPSNANAFIKSYLKSEINIFVNFVFNVVEQFKSSDGFFEYFVVGTVKSIGKKIFEDEEKIEQNKTK